MIFLFLAAWMALLAAVYTRLRTVAGAMCWTAVLHGVWIVGVTEALSLFHGLRAGPIALAHAILAAAAWWFARGQHRRIAIEIGRGLRDAWRQASWFERALAGAVAAILFCVLAVALVAPPNTIDALVYHLPRVVYWLQEGAIHHFPAASTQQLYMPPFHEYVLLHLHALLGTDRLANTVSVYWFVITIVAAAFLARQLGGGRSIQVAAGFFVATLQQGILAASGSKNGWTPAALILLSAVMMVALREHRWRGYAMLGSAAGLAVLSKGTAYLFLPPLFLAALLFDRETRARLLSPRGIALACGAALVLNLGHGYRNAATFGSPVGPATAVPGACPYALETFGPKPLFSNLVRNTALHLATPSVQLNQTVASAARQLLIKAAINPDDPATTWCGGGFGLSTEFLVEDYAANTLHFGWIAALIVYAGARWRRVPRAQRMMLSAAVLGYVLFCAYLIWQPWHTRLHLPAFALAASPGAWLLTRLPGPARWAVAGIVFAGALLAATFNQLRPIAGFYGRPSILRTAREDVMLNGIAPQHHSMTEAARVVKESGCREVGIDVIGEPAVYPALRTLNLGSPAIRAREYGVRNHTRSLEDSRRSPPCAILCISCGARPDLAERFGSGYVLTHKFGDVGVLLRRGGSTQ